MDKIFQLVIILFTFSFCSELVKRTFDVTIEGPFVGRLTLNVLDCVTGALVVLVLYG